MFYRGLCSVGVSLSCVFITPLVHAEASYPTMPVKVVVPYIGGPPDLHARVFGEYFHQVLKQPLVVENKGGAGGMIAAQAVTTAPKDGYTLLWAASSLFGVNPFVYRSLPYSLEQFQPISNIAEVCFSISARPELKFKTLSDLVAAMKKEPGKINFANTGVGNQLHLTWERFLKATGTQATTITYKSGPDAVTSLIGGFSDVMVNVLSSSDTQMYNKGMLVPLATTCRERVPQAPDVPTMAELGYKDFVVYGSYQLFAPKGVAPEVIAKLSQTAETVKRNPEYVKRIAALIATPAVEKSPEEFAQWLQRDRKMWSTIAKEANVVVEN